MAFVFTCRLCLDRQEWSTQRAAQAAAVWHVYDTHRPAWVDTVGHDHEPADKRPTEHGTRLGFHLEGGPPMTAPETSQDALLDSMLRQLTEQGGVLGATCVAGEWKVIVNFGEEAPGSAIGSGSSLAAALEQALAAAGWL